MRPFALSALLLLSGTALIGQTLDPNNSDGDHGGFTLTPELDLDGTYGAVEEVEREKVTVAQAARLRALDRVSGIVTDLEVGVGTTARIGRLTLELGECRYPEDNPSGDAYGYLTIRQAGITQAVFQGWMVASSPALNALDHPRYDVWLLRCSTS